MTIAICLKVHDGIVLAADSAVTQVSFDNPAGQDLVRNIYTNAIKVFRLHTKLPLGVVTWGLGNIGRHSLKLLAKDFRTLLENSPEFDPRNYTVGEVAKRFKEFMVDGCYANTFSALTRKPFLGFFVAGYSSNQSFGEVFRILVENGWCSGPSIVIPEGQVSVVWGGQPQAIERLFKGYEENRLVTILNQFGLQPNQVDQIIQKCANELGAPLVDPLMPIQDAIDLAVFLARTTAQYTWFCEGPDSVSEPIDVATLTKYEGFKWIQRKHFYDKALNS